MFLVCANSDSEKRENINSERAKSEKVCNLRNSFTYDMV